MCKQQKRYLWWWNTNLPGGAHKEHRGEGRRWRGPALTCLRHEGDKKKKIPDEFPVRLVLPASCRTYQLSYQLGQAFAGKLVTVVDAQKGLILVLLGGIIKPHVEGMLAVYAVSLEMLGWKCKGENQTRVTAK